MEEAGKTREHLVAELAAVRDQVAPIEAAESNLRILLENSPNFILIVDRQSRVQYVNRSVIGVPPEQMLGSLGFRHIVPEGQPHCREALERAFVEGEVQTLEARTIYGKCWNCRLVPMLGSRGDPAVMIICTDITHDKAVAVILEAQRHIVTAINGISSADEAFELCCETAMRVAGLEYGGVFVADRANNFHLRFARGVPEDFKRTIGLQKAGSPLAQMIARGKPRYYRASEASPENRPALLAVGFRGVAVLPIMHKQEPVACLVCASCQLEEISQQSKHALEVIAASVGGALARIMANQMLVEDQKLLRKLIELQERERKLVAYDIHDGFMQDVVGAKMHLDGVLAALPVPLDGVSTKLSAAQDLLAAAVREGRRMISELRPLIIDEEGVVASVEYLLNEAEQRCGLKTRLEHAVEFERLDPVLEGVIFRIVQEAVANAERHSQSEFVTVRLRQQADRLSVEIEDEGVGFDLDRVPTSRFGLRGIRERARLFDGEAAIVSSPGKGTRITVELPATVAVSE